MAEEKTKLNVITSLADFAAADAEHDFSSARAGGNLFANIFKKHKFIGTPTLPAENTSTEYEILNKFLNIFDENSPPPSPEQPAAFQAKFLKEGETFKFNRWADDKDDTGAPIGYTVKAKKVAIKGSRGREWTLGAEALYDWLNVKGTGVAFMIDATSVPFYELFTEEEGPTVKTVYHVNGREGINDAAGKVVIDQKPKKTYKVNVEAVDDTLNEGIVYPTILPLMTNTSIKDVIDTVTDRELFYSNFSIFLSPIKTKGKLKSVNMEIATRDYSKQINLLKGQKEDAHPNAVSTLTKMIMSVFKGIFKDSKGTSSIERTKYYSYLQQKRSGDWLQVLSTLDTGRFAVPKGCRISMVTMDKICAAYQIAMGGDCIFTYAKTGNASNPTEYWLVYFYRGEAEDADVALQNDIAFTKESMNPDAKIFPFLANPGTYRAAVKDHATIFQGQIKAAEDAIRLVIRGYKKPSRVSASLIESTAKNVMLEAVKLAVIHLHAQDVSIDELSVFVNPLPENASALLSRYKKNYIYIKSVLSNVMKKTAEIGNIEASATIKLFFDRIRRSNHNAAEEFIKLIENLKIFGRLFTKGNSGKNGLGVFSFLNNSIPNGAIKDEIIEFFNGRLDELSGSDKNAYTTFLATVRLLTDSATDSDRELLIPGAMAGGDPSGVNQNGLYPKVSDAELLEVVDSLHSKSVTEAEVEDAIAEAVAAVAAAAARAAARAAAKGQEHDLRSRKVPFATAPLVYDDNEEDVDEQPDPARITDYQAAATILAERVNETFAKRGIGIPEEGLAEGGGEPQRYHSPLVTYYLLLREISFRMSYQKGEFKTLDAFANIILNTLATVAKEPKEKQGAYFSALEVFFLEQINTYEGLPEELSASRHYIEQIMLSVKDGYYGFRHIPDAYIHPTDSIKEILESAMNITPASGSVDDTIDNILAKMTSIIHFMGPSKRSKRNSRKRSNVTKKLNTINSKKLTKNRRFRKYTHRNLPEVTKDAAAAAAAGGSRSASSLR